MKEHKYLHHCHLPHWRTFNLLQAAVFITGKRNISEFLFLSREEKKCFQGEENISKMFMDGLLPPMKY